MKFFDLGLDDIELRREIDSAFDRVVRSGWMILGAELEAFEGEFAAYCGATSAIGVGNGYDALVLALRAGGVRSGDEVIVPAHTFAATWLAVIAVGARPVPVDSDPPTYVVSISAVEAAITSRTTAIIAVSLYGHPVDIDALMTVAKRHGLFVLEDAAQSHGASYRGRRTGSLTHATAFSFYPTKNLGALGDGGAVTTNDDALAARIRHLRNYGSSEKYHHNTLGVNSRLDEMQAAFLRVFLRRLEARNDNRRHLAGIYRHRLGGQSDLTVPTEADWARHVFHLFVIRSPRRDELRSRLQAADVGCGVHYPVPCHLQPAFSDLGFHPGQFSQCEQFSREVLSLPMWPGMADSDVDRVCEVLLAPRP